MIKKFIRKMEKKGKDSGGNKYFKYLKVTKDFEISEKK